MLVVSAGRMCGFKLKQTFPYHMSPACPLLPIQLSLNELLTLRDTATCFAVDCKLVMDKIKINFIFSKFCK